MGSSKVYAVLGLVFLIGMHGIPGYAGDATESGKGEKLDDITVTGRDRPTLTGIRDRPLVEQPGAANIISPEKLSTGHYMSTTDALRTVPGVHVIAEYGRGLRPNIGIRGLDPNRSRNVLVLADGVPVQPAVYGDPAMYYNVPIESVEQIEIIRGATSVLYGPNTIGGVINYTMRRPPKNGEFRLSETVREGGFFVTQASYGNTGDNGVGAVLSYLNKSGETVRDNTGTEVHDVNLRLIVPTENDGEMTMRMNAYREIAETPGGLTVAQFKADPDQSQRSFDEFFGRRGSFDLRYVQPIGNDWTIDSLAYMNFFERNWFIANAPGPDGPTGNSQFLREFFVIGVEPRLR